MKRVLVFLLALSMVLALCACGETAPAATPEPTPEPTPLYSIGDTVSTDIMSLKLEASEPAIALDNHWGLSGSEDWGKTAYTPKEYNAAEDAKNPYVAAKGHTLIYFCITLSNLDRARLAYASSSSDLARYYKIAYNGESAATLKTGSMISNVDHYIGTSSGGILKIEPGTWCDTTVLGLEPGETSTARLFFDIPTDIENLTEGYTLSFELPNSDGSKSIFSFFVPAK